MIVQDRSDFVSVAEAARILGISKSTVKRRIAAGQLDAEQLQRAQGVEYRVRIHRDVPVPSINPSDSERMAPSTGTPQDDPAAITAAVAPLLERLVVADTIIAGHTSIIREQAEIIGMLRAERDVALAELTANRGMIRDQAEALDRQAAELDVLRAAQRQQAANPGPVAPAPTTDAPVPLTARLRALAPWLLAALAIVAVLVLLVWLG